MRKIILLITILVLLFLTVACEKKINNKETTSTTTQADTLTSTNNTPTEFTVAESEESAINDIGGGIINPQKYRVCFYQIPTFFSELVDKKAYDEWCNTYLAENYPDNTKEMVIVSFIKKFNISREDFDKANVEYGKFVEEYYYDACMNPKDFAEQEFSEVYNADIIYTFDNELISEYYLGNDYAFFYEDEYLAALDTGTYETRTTDFIDIEQMEAEIIAKYGEAEIVTEQETTTAEAVTTDLPQTETIE